MQQSRTKLGSLLVRALALWRRANFVNARVRVLSLWRRAHYLVFAGRDVGTRWCVCSRCGAVRIFFGFAGRDVGTRWCGGGSRYVCFGKPRAKRFFLQLKCDFRWQGRRAVISSCRVRLRALGQSEL